MAGSASTTKGGLAPRRPVEQPVTAVEDEHYYTITRRAPSNAALHYYFLL